MSTFKMIEKLGLKIWDYKEPHHHFAVDAKELEVLLLRAQVVYGSTDTPSDQLAWSNTQLDCDTHSALLVGMTPIKKMTKAEAALQFLEEIQKTQNDYYAEKAKRILNMKDDE